MRALLDYLCSIPNVNAVLLALDLTSLGKSKIQFRGGSLPFSKIPPPLIIVMLSISSAKRDL